MRQIVLFILLISTFVFAQTESKYVDDDGIPFLTKNLPDWENAQKNSTYIVNKTQLTNALGEKPLFDLIDFTGGNEAVTANYAQGKLLIVEFNTPQTSVEADLKITQFLNENPQNPPIFYRRIGNYNTFVFEAKDETSANFLLEQIVYGKVVQWLGEDPYYQKKVEKYIAQTGLQVAVSTVLAFLIALLSSIGIGLLFGYLYFRYRTKKQTEIAAFSDAGGMIRLNLDGLSADSNKLLGE
jgi:hypothetical protein